MKKRVNIMIDPINHKKGQKLAVENGLSFSSFVAFLICQYEKTKGERCKTQN